MASVYIKEDATERLTAAYAGNSDGRLRVFIFEAEEEWTLMSTSRQIVQIYVYKKVARAKKTRSKMLARLTENEVDNVGTSREKFLIYIVP